MAKSFLDRRMNCFFTYLEIDCKIAAREGKTSFQTEYFEGFVVPGGEDEERTIFLLEKEERNVERYYFQGVKHLAAGLLESKFPLEQVFNTLDVKLWEKSSQSRFLGN